MCAVIHREVRCSLFCSAGPWREINVYFPVMTEGREDWMYLPVFLKLDRDRLLEWTTARPTELLHPEIRPAAETPGPESSRSSD